jgi:hypothetical protein
VVLDAKGLETIYVVETDLALTPEDPEFDRKAFDDFVKVLRDYLVSHPHFTSVRLHRIYGNANA